jgi:CBS domain containing-hemolysin-like protein
MSTPLAIALSVVFLVANGFFVAAEFALLAARRSRIEQLASAGSRGALAAHNALRELSLMLAGAQLGITIASLGLGAIAEPAFAHVLEDLFEAIGLPEGLAHPAAFVLALSFVVFVHMVVGEMAPKSWAITHPERSAVLLARPFRAFTLLVRPFLHLLNGAANGFLRLFGVRAQEDHGVSHSAAELAVLLAESTQTGTIESDDAELLSRALGLSGLTAESAMVQRDEVDAVPASAGIDQIESVAAPRRRSRLVVFGNDLDDVRGVVHMRDVVALDLALRDDTTAEELAYSIVWVDADTPLEDVLLAMQRAHRHVAAVRRDGRLIGIVTMADVLRHLIGQRPSASVS